MVSPSYSTASMVAVWLLKNCCRPESSPVAAAGAEGTCRDSNNEFHVAVSTENPSLLKMGRSPLNGLLVAYGFSQLSGYPSESMIRHRWTGMVPGRGEAAGVGSRVGSHSTGCKRSGGPSPGRCRSEAVLSAGHPELGST